MFVDYYLFFFSSTFIDSHLNRHSDWSSKQFAYVVARRKLQLTTDLRHDSLLRRRLAEKLRIQDQPFHPRCTTMSSYGISWFRKWNTFSRMISFACSSWLRFVITPGENSHLPGRALACKTRKMSLTPCPLSAERLRIDEPSSLIPS